MPDLDDALLAKLLREQAQSIDVSSMSIKMVGAERSRRRRRVALIAAPLGVVAVIVAGATLSRHDSPNRLARSSTPASVSGTPDARGAAPMSSRVLHQDPAPAAFASVCGHPGASVTVRSVPVTVNHATCDLTGVIVRLPNGYGSVVPAEGTSQGDFDSAIGATPASGGISVAVDPETGDVTISADS